MRVVGVNPSGWTFGSQILSSCLQARVRRAGYSVQTRSFLTKAEAERWARSVEVEIDRGAYETPIQAKQASLGDLIDRYMREVTPKNEGCQIRLDSLGGHPAAGNIPYCDHPPDGIQSRNLPGRTASTSQLGDRNTGTGIPLSHH